MFTGGIAAAALSGLPRSASAGDAGVDHSIGDFMLPRTETGLAVLHRGQPGRFLWATSQDGKFLGAQQASATIKRMGDGFARSIRG